MKTNKKEIILIISSFLVGGIFMLILVKYTPLIKDIIGSKNDYVLVKNGTQVYEKNSLAASVEKVYDAVVVIESYKEDEIINTGTGFVYKVDEKYGYILTNEPVLSNGEKIVVTFTSEKQEEVKVLGKDEYLDLAILRVKKEEVKATVEIGNAGITYRCLY